MLRYSIARRLLHACSPAAGESRQWAFDSDAHGGYGNTDDIDRWLAVRAATAIARSVAVCSVTPERASPVAKDGDPMTWLMACRGLVSSVLVLSATGPAVAQGVPVTNLSQPAASTETEFVRITGIHERSDGRVVVVDSDGRMVASFDRDLTTQKRIGRVGRGPGEYELPEYVVALRGDSSAVWDRASSRFLIVTREGLIGGSIDGRWHRACPGKTGVRLEPVRARDQHGHLFSQAAPIRTAADGSRVPADSAAVERWDGCSRDTVAFVPSRIVADPRVVGEVVMGAVSV